MHWFWTFGGIAIWIAVLALPLIIYFVIASYQVGRPKRGPELGPPVDEDLAEREKEEKKRRNAS